MSATFGLAFVLPGIAESDPSYVTDVLDTFTGGTATGDVGVLGTLFQIQSACYLAGGLLFGVALYRAHVLARWAAALLAVGGLVSAALAVMPDAFYRLIALPNGIALIGLGYSLWRSQRQVDDPTAVDAEGASRAHCGSMTFWTSTWRVPIALVALGTVPVIAGALRLVELSGGTAILPSDARTTRRRCRSCCTSSVPRCSRSWGRSSSRRACGGGPAGTAEPGDCWSSPGWGWRCRRCG